MWATRPHSCSRGSKPEACLRAPQEGPMSPHLIVKPAGQGSEGRKQGPKTRETREKGQQISQDGKLFEGGALPSSRPLCAGPPVSYCGSGGETAKSYGLGSPGSISRAMWGGGSQERVFGAAYTAGGRGSPEATVCPPQVCRPPVIKMQIIRPQPKPTECL